jgi:hypothetical protein
MPALIIGVLVAGFVVGFGLLLLALSVDWQH